MTAPLHHINQLYLHLPAINGQVAAHEAIGQDLRQMAQKAQDESYRRDLVELVSEAAPGAETVGVRSGSDPLAKARERSRPVARAKDSAKAAKASGDSQNAPLAPDSPLVSVRV